MLTGEWEKDLDGLITYTRTLLIPERDNETYKFVYEFIWRDLGCSSQQKLDGSRRGAGAAILRVMKLNGLITAEEICEKGREALASVSRGVGPLKTGALQRAIIALRAHCGLELLHSVQAEPNSNPALTVADVTADMLHAIKAAGAWTCPLAALQFLVKMRQAAGFDFRLAVYREMVSDFVKSNPES